MNRLQNCLNPKYITNKYTGEKIAVRCGKCVVCRNTKSALWVQRLEQESYNHRYTYFVTLQYDEQHVPQMVLLDKKDSLSFPSYFDSFTQEVISLDDVSYDGIKRNRQKEVEFCLNTKVLNVLSKRDVQLFVKRLRELIRKIDKNARIRFFICGEYGPQTFRPHYHCLFFFEEEWISKRFEELLLRVWPHGFVFDPHPITGDASEYVASYVNCTAHLPKIMLHPSIRPFALFSKQPIIGNFKNPLIDLRKIFFEASVTMRIFKPSSRVFLDVPLWRSLQCRLFPRIARYDSLDDEVRRILYGSFYNYYCSGAKETECFESVRESYRNGFLFEGYLKRYLSTILFVENLKTGLREYHEVALLNYVRVCYRTYKLADKFGVDVGTIINQIFTYYEKVKKSRFVDYLKYQDEYFKLHPVQDYVLFDASFVESVNGKMSSELSFSQRTILENYGICCDPVSLDYQSSFDYKELQALHIKIAFDTSKTKKSNDYLLAHKDKFGNIVKYKNL